MVEIAGKAGALAALVGSVRRSAVIGGLTVALVAHGGLCAEPQAADAILQAAGIEGGLVVHLALPAEGQERPGLGLGERQGDAAARHVGTPAWCRAAAASR